MTWNWTTALPTIFKEYTTTERDAFGDPPENVVIFNTTTNQHETFFESVWSPFVIGDSASVDNELVRWNGTGGNAIGSPSTALATTTATLNDNVDLTLYDATNDGNPSFSYGSSATERLFLTMQYASGTKSLESVIFQTLTLSGTADRGKFLFAPDQVTKLIIDDGGIEITGSISVTGSIAGITATNLVDKAATEVITGSWDFGGATQFELPNSDAPTSPNVDGEIVFDNLVTNWSTGLIKIFMSGEEQGVVTMPISEFTTPTDNHVVTYNSTTDEFELQAGGGGGGDVATDVIWDAKGDLAGGTGADTAVKLSVGANGKHLEAASGETTGMKWGDFPKRSIMLTPQGGTPSTTTGCSAPLLTETASTVKDYWSLGFAANESAFYQVMMPDNWDGDTTAMTAVFYWNPKTGASVSDTVIWGIKGAAFGDSDALTGTYGTQRTVTDTVITIGDVHISSATSSSFWSTSPVAGELGIIEIERTGGTMSEEAELLGVKLIYQTDSNTDA